MLGKVVQHDILTHCIVQATVQSTVLFCRPSPVNTDVNGSSFPWVCQGDQHTIKLRIDSAYWVEY